MRLGLAALACLWVAARGALGALTDPSQQTLAVLYQQNYYANPLLGIGLPPPGTTILPAWGNTANFTADVQMIIEEITVDSFGNSFDARYTWHLRYNDSRFFNLYWEDETDASNCTSMCSTLPNAVVNKLGQDACCDQCYNPNAHFLNLKGSRLTAVPQEWYWYGSPDSDQVHYYFRGRSTFNGNYNFKAFPFGKQRLQFLIFGDFIPRLIQPSFLLSAATSTLPLPMAAAQWPAPGQGPEPPHQGPPIPGQGPPIPGQGPPIPGHGPPIPGDGLPPPGQGPGEDLTGLTIEGWDLTKTSSASIGFEFYRNAHAGLDGEAKYVGNASRPGLSFTIIVARGKKSFYAQLFVIPPALEVLLVFAGYGLTMDTLRNRMEYLGVLFLSLFVIQFSVRSFLPAATFLNPYRVCLICYGYIFIFAASFLCTAMIADAHSTTKRAKISLAARLKFEYFRRDRLKQMHSEAEHDSQAPGGAVPTTAAVDRWLAANRAKIDKLEAAEKALDGPWYLRHQSNFMLYLLRRSAFVRRLDKWWYCLTRSSAELYCRHIALRLERVFGVVLFVSFYLTLTLVYVLQKRLNSRIGPL